MTKRVFFIITVFITLIVPAVSFAGKSEFDEMKKLEGKEIDKGDTLKVARPTVKYDAMDLRDPFKSSFKSPNESSPENKIMVASQPPKHLSVQGLIWGSKLPQAIVNGQVVKIGDTIGDALVTDIGKSGVKVIYQGAEYVVAAPMSEFMPQTEPGGKK